eukprot:991822-Amphidinium_carterae.1
MALQGFDEMHRHELIQETSLDTFLDIGACTKNSALHSNNPKVAHTASSPSSCHFLRSGLVLFTILLCSSQAMVMPTMPPRAHVCSSHHHDE